MAARASEPKFFRDGAAFRRWLAANHAKADSLLVGFHRVGSGRGGLTYPDALDEALCVGWIDGLRRGLDATSYSIRFSPRKPGSIWSQVNIRKVAALEAAGRMTAAGRAVFEKRDPRKAFQYSFEVGRHELAPAFAKRLAADARARAWFAASPPSYQRPATHWVMSAKQEATRERRFAALLACSREGRKVPPLDYPKSSPTKAPSKPARRRS